MSIRSRRRALLMLLSAPLLGAVAGCATVTEPWLPPEVSLRSITPQRLDAGRQTLLLGLHLTNPNDRTLPIRAMTYRLALEGTEVARGDGALERQLPAFGSAAAEVSVETDLARLLPLLPTLMLASRPLRYRIDGTATVANLIPLPFRHDGEVDAAAALRRALR